MIIKSTCDTNCCLCARDGPQMLKKKNGGSRGVMVTVVGNGHADTSSNPGRD